jgi:nucleoside-diphosphate-sugar epimerase
MSDAIKATIEIMQAPKESIKIRSSYNISGMSFSPKEISEEIKTHFPNFEISYNIDYRQKIAESWPQSIDDSSAKKDWGWNPIFSLSNMTFDMISNLNKALEKEKLS